jgi:hypothetical protein
MMNPFHVLNEARKSVPVVNYALGVAGVAAAGAIVTLLVGRGLASLVLMVLIFIGMILLYLFSTLAKSNSTATRIAGTVLVWAVLLFFVVFLCLTVSVFLGYGPEAWARFIGVQVVPPPDAVPEKISIHAERYTNIRRLGERLLTDYLLVKLHPDGSFDIIQSKTPGINLVIPELVLFKIQGSGLLKNRKSHRIQIE